MSIASASGSSRSVRRWACRRPPIIGAPPASGARERWVDERLLVEIRRVHRENYECYGSRRVWKQLHREGIGAARCTVERLMAAHGIQGAKRRGKPWRTTRQDPAGRHAPDLVERDFTADAPNRLWVADFTYLRCWEGVVFFAFVIDVFSRMVVGWQLACHMRDDLVLDALRMALGLREPGANVALVHHSDRGSQYGSQDYTQTLEDHHVTGRWARPAIAMTTRWPSLSWTRSRPS